MCFKPALAFFFLKDSNCTCNVTKWVFLVLTVRGADRGITLSSMKGVKSVRQMHFPFMN